MKPIKAVLLLLASLLLSAPIRAEQEGPKGEETQARECMPSVVELAPDEPINADVEYWRVHFKVALVGCADKLETLTEDELDTLREEFRQPAEWSNLLLVNKETKQDLKSKAVQRVTELLGRQVVTDILFYEIAILDHNVL